MTTLAAKRKRWRRHIDRIRGEQVEWLAHHVAFFTAFQASIRQGRVRRGSITHELADWMAVNYLAFASMWVRKTAEPAPPKPKKKGARDRRILSLRNLLDELVGETDSMTFARFRRMFRGTAVPARIVRAQWVRVVGDRERVLRSMVKADIRRIERATAEVKKFVDKQVAHTGLNRKLHSETSFGAIRVASDLFLGLLRKYELILFARVVQPPDYASDEIRDMLAVTWGAGG